MAFYLQMIITKNIIFYSFAIMTFHIIITHNLLFSISYAIPSGDNDKMLIEFVRNDQKMKISEYSKQKYEAHLGILYCLRMNWQCDKIDEKFDEFERTECQKYRKYLDILYEYLYREYAGIATVKPKFVLGYGKLEIDGPIICVVKWLVIISRFYFQKQLKYEYKLHELFIYYVETKLLNEKRLNYLIKSENKPKLSTNEMIMQLAIDTANKYPKNESLDGIIRQNFDKSFEEMLKRAEKRKEQDGSDDDDDEFITWIDDALFSEFVKGLATNPNKFLKMAKEYSNYLCQRIEKENIYGDDEIMISFGFNEIEKMVIHFALEYETLLGLVYLMRENWHCEKGTRQLTEFGRKECQKNSKYLDILYEYLFRIYAAAKSPKMSKQMPPLVKPIFTVANFPKSLINVVQKLNFHSIYFWQRDSYGMWELDLVNEDELNYEIKDEKIGNNASKNEAETNFSKLRKEFEALMEKICKNAIEEKAKLEKAMSETENNEEKEALEEEYNNKFGIFNSSPFS